METLISLLGIGILFGLGICSRPDAIRSTGAPWIRALPQSRQGARFISARRRGSGGGIQCGVQRTQ